MSCNHHRYHHDKHRKRSCYMPGGRILWGVIVFVLILFVIAIFVVCINFKPSNPEFVLKDIVVYSLNISSSPINTISITMQVTLMSKNCNNRISINYLEPKVFASYCGEEITCSTLLPLTYQGPDGITFWSPVVYGNAVPISSELIITMTKEVNFGELLFAIRVTGKVKWKVAMWTSTSHSLSVDCPVSINFNNLNFTTGVVPVFPLSQGCNVAV